MLCQTDYYGDVFGLIPSTYSRTGHIGIGWNSKHDFDYSVFEKDGVFICHLIPITT